MSALRITGNSIRARLQSRREAMLQPGYMPAPERECAGTELGQRLAIAALYGGKGDQPQAHAAALLACAGVADSPDARAAVLTDLDEIFRRVRIAVAGAHA